MMRSTELRITWLTWLLACVSSGFAICIVEWLVLGKSPGIHWAIAVFAGSVVSGLLYPLVRSGEPRFGAIAPIAMGGMVGAESGSVIKAVVIAGFASILTGFLARVTERRWGGPRATMSEPVDRLPSDSC
jgi:hypothetical protein